MKKTAVMLLTAVLACLVITVCTDKGTNGGGDDVTLYPWDFLPADNSVGTWAMDTTSAYKIWHDADHPDAYLSDFINGGDGAYVPFGFVRGTRISYRDSSGATATLNLFEFPNADSVLSLYAILGQGISTTPITTLGDSARLDEAGLFNSSIESIRDRYYLDIDAPEVSMTDAESLVAKAITNIDNYLD